MERTKKPLIFIDTHIIVWLYDALGHKFTKRAKEAINEGQVVISPVSKLELEYLHEIKRLKPKPEPVVMSLENSTGATVSQSSFMKIIDTAITLSWTRDLFDGLIVADALINNACLVTKDKTILKNYPLAIW